MVYGRIILRDERRGRGGSSMSAFDPPLLTERMFGGQTGWCPSGSAKLRYRGSIPPASTIPSGL
jgi:hypothetical protein